MKHRAVALLAVVVAVVAGCSPSSGHSGFSGSGSTAAPVTTPSTTTVAPSTSAAPTKPTPLDLATRHAPVYRFNAWQGTDTSVANRDEDFFPQSVVRFFDELNARSARISTHIACKAQVGINEIVAFPGPVTIDAKAIRGMPQRMAGDVPGQAPVYFHAFEDTSARVRNPDGSGEDLFYVEYWLFYPKDICLITIGTVPLPLYIGGHRGDWESTSYAIALVLGPGGAFQRSEIRRGYFNMHHDQVRCQRAELELLNEHPAVYISVGKHASYPEPGKWLNRFKIAPIAHFDDVFFGNGFEWESAQAPLIDLDGPLSNEFAPASFVAIPSSYADWRDFPGSWGPDAGFGPLPGSPVSPRWAAVWNKGDGAVTQDWAAMKAAAPATDLVLGAVPKVVPAPVPVRR